jgi:hypothetical protein
MVARGTRMIRATLRMEWPPIFHRRVGHLSNRGHRQHFRPTTWVTEVRLTCVTRLFLVVASEIRAMWPWHPTESGHGQANPGNMATTIGATASLGTPHFRR